jgi:putative sugar O-methyltransferase
MLADDEDMDAFYEKEAVARKKFNDSEASHEKWMAEAIASDPRDGRDETILSDARRHLEAARLLDPPVVDIDGCLDSRWLEWSKSFYENTKQFTTCRDVLHYAQAKIPFDHREPAKPRKSEFLIFEKLVNEEFPHRLETQFSLHDNVKSIPDTLHWCYGEKRLTSNVFYWHMRIMFRCQEDVPMLDRILEIGGGYGALARLWMINKTAKIRRYVIVDLPESLFYSEVCLRAELGDDIGYWEGKDPGTRIVLVPIGRLHEYTAMSDLVINVGSMQEMSDTWVSFYMTWLDQYKPRFFYSLNYMGQAITAMHESRTFWAPRPSMAWATRSQTADVTLVKMMCCGRDFVETIYERATPVQKFSDWSVLKGCFFNRETYLEGLELLRQDMTVDNAKMFLSIVTKNNDLRRILCPKEILWIAACAHKATGDPALKKLVDALSGVEKIGTY